MIGSIILRGKESDGHIRKGRVPAGYILIYQEVSAEHPKTKSSYFNFKADINTAIESSL
jgi:hypothetical protein